MIFVDASIKYRSLKVTNYEERRAWLAKAWPVRNFVLGCKDI
jgi:hypothetical protein